MTLVKPTLLEDLYSSLLNLDSENINYYKDVIKVGRGIFTKLLSMSREEGNNLSNYETEYQGVLDEIDRLIYYVIEKPLEAPLKTVLDTFYSFRFMAQAKAYIKVGDQIDYRLVYKPEISNRLEYISDYIYKKVWEVSGLIRFTRHYEMRT